MYLTLTTIKETTLEVDTDSGETEWPVDIRRDGRLFMSLSRDEAKQLRDGLSIALADLAEKDASHA